MDTGFSNHLSHILGDEQMLRILGRGHSVPHGHRIDFCECTVFTNFAIKEIYSMWNNNWIQLLFHIE